MLLTITVAPNHTVDSNKNHTVTPGAASTENTNTNIIASLLLVQILKKLWI